MIFYKVLSDGVAIDTGCMWLKWNERHNILMNCDPKDAQFIQGINDTVYRVAWLNPIPPELAERFETVEAKTIDQQEYYDLLAALSEGETVPEPIIVVQEPVREPMPTQEQEGPMEQPMSLREMRAKIMKLEEALNSIMEQSNDAVRR